jgi:hypothetical protein
MQRGTGRPVPLLLHPISLSVVDYERVSRFLLHFLQVGVGCRVLFGAPSRRRDLLELALGYGLVLAAIWTAMPVQRVFFWIGFVVIVLFTALRYESLASLGLAITGMGRLLWIVALALFLAGAAMLIAIEAGTLHSVFGNLPFGFRVSGYLVWSFAQEFMLQIFVLMRLVGLLPRRSHAIAAAAVLFAIAHLPNPVLVPLTLLWGLIACTLFLRYRNLYVVGLCHAVLGICVAVTVPNAMHHHMRVGLGYYRYRQPHHAGHRRSAPQTVSTQACVIMEALTRRSDRQARP